MDFSSSVAKRTRWQKTLASKNRTGSSKLALTGNCPNGKILTGARFNDLECVTRRELKFDGEDVGRASIVISEDDDEEQRVAEDQVIAGGNCMARRTSLSLGSGVGRQLHASDAVDAGKPDQALCQASCSSSSSSSLQFDGLHCKDREESGKVESLDGNKGAEESGPSQELGFDNKKRKILETNLKRFRVEGIEILHNLDGDNGNVDGVDSWVSIANRTRSHFHSGPNKKIGIRSKKNSGTISNPVVLDAEYNPSSEANDDSVADDSDSLAEDEDSSDSASLSNTNDGDDDNNDGNCDKASDDVRVQAELSVEGKCEGEDEVQRRKSRKRKRIRAPKRKRVCAPPNDGSLFNTLMDAFLKKGVIPSKELASAKAEKAPLIFSFKDTTSEQKEKSDVEKDQLEDLWAEFNIAMSSENIGSFSSSAANNEETKTEEFETDQATLCRQGMHQFVLNEQIGIACRFCSFVECEIRNFLPSLAKNKWGQSESKGYTDKYNHLWHGLPFEDGKVDGRCTFGHAIKTVWDIIGDEVKKTMYTHQQEGFEFIWKSLAGSIVIEEVLKPARLDGLGGCVISHAPGTGKTRLALLFLKSFMHVFPDSRPLIVAPVNILLTWEREFKRWNIEVPFHILNRNDFTGEEDNIVLGFRDMHKGKNWVRFVKIFSWAYGCNSILGVSYSLLKRFLGKSSLHDKELSVISKFLMEEPGLLVLDEGHTPRNDHSLIWKALAKIKTDRRIILSGTPFQNNFHELYNTLCLVRPKFADKLATSEICQKGSKMLSANVCNVLRRRRGGRGRWASLTNSIGVSTVDRLEKLRSIINPFVHVHKGSVLNKLPGLKDCLIYLHPLNLQKSILESVQKLVPRDHFKEEFIISMLSIHPSLLLECDLSDEEMAVVDEHQLEAVRLDSGEGVKTWFVMELVHLAAATNEKVLIFSQFIKPLSFMKEHLEKNFNWALGKEVLLMDGSVDMKSRQSLIDCFNDPSSEARVLLASTKSCCEGINLIGASRVILLDVVWNPSVERQAISRAYRLGQQKVVHTYHLITSGTTEGEKYDRQAEKDRLSELIFSSGGGECADKHSSIKMFEDRILEEMVGNGKLKSIFGKILCEPRMSNLVEALGREHLK